MVRIANKTIGMSDFFDDVLLWEEKMGRRCRIVVYITQATVDHETTWII